MKELKYFNQLSEYTADKDNFTYPTVSHVKENTKVYYKEKPEVRIVTYTTTGASQQVRLVNNQEYLDYCKIVDTGEELTVTGTGDLNYTFENSGEHQVELKFKDDATTLASGFSYCGGLTSIPENLFSNCTAVTSFSYTFQYCDGLTSIPANLFANNTTVTSFNNAFTSCTELTSIPENLFKYNTAVTNFSSTFRSCIGLTSIPETLFSNNTAVTNFENTFFYCSGLTGNTPVDSDGTPTYNRSGEGKEGYAAVAYYDGCFYKCTGLTDYTSIPISWR